MVVRIWTTGVAAGREAEYLRFAQERSRRMFAALPGCLGVLFLRVTSTRHAACSFWRSRTDLAALASSRTYRETAAALAASGAIEGNAEVLTYDLEGGALDVPAFLAALRATAVVVAP